MIGRRGFEKVVTNERTNELTKQEVEVGYPHLKIGTPLSLDPCRTLAEQNRTNFVLRSTPKWGAFKVSTPSNPFGVLVGCFLLYIDQL